jgi:galactokinase
VTQDLGNVTDLVTRVRQAFRERFGGEARVAVAPGRVNLIGEHTDYNDGFVMPMAIDLGVAVAYRARTDRTLVVHSATFGEGVELDVAALERPAPAGWATYVAGVAWAMAREGIPLGGADVVIDGDVPVGAGLSSSAALEVALARAFADLAGIEWHPAEGARMARVAENEFVGVACGIMDQMAAALSRAGCAMLLDCRSLAGEPVPIPDDAAVAILDSGVRRSLTASAYNSRRAECERAVDGLRRSGADVGALRDASVAQLDAARVAGVLDDVAYRRARHVVEENERTLRFARALAGGHLGAAGGLMNASHESLRDLHEVSSPELDAVVECARAQPTCLGARMTGAGFGGCAVALVRAPALAEFVADVENECRRRTPGWAGAVFPVHASAGAHLAQ